MLNGMVINSNKNLFNVKTIDGKIYNCRVKGKLIKADTKVNNLVIIGDNVEFQTLSGNDGLIHKILARKSKFSRKAAGTKSFEQIIAVNLDQVIIVASVKNPDYRLNGIERYISAAHAGNMIPVVCFNKIDLIDRNDISEDIESLKKNGVRIIFTSTETGEGLSELKEILKDKISVFTGSSGVGKSSLVNMLENSDLARTDSIGENTNKGKHTTTSSYIYELDFGGMILDTPGMREFGLFDSDEGVKQTFSDIEEFAKSCKFGNCSHTHEPACEVKNALDRGDIELRRYKSYIKLINKRS